MLPLFKRLFGKKESETIAIFEKETKMEYGPRIFHSFKALSLPHCKLHDLEPLRPFIHLETLNLSDNYIVDVEALRGLQRLKTLDLRFNRISRLPDWMLLLEKRLYWERTNPEQEGIFLEGNPLNKTIIERIKERSITPKPPPNREEKSVESSPPPLPKKRPLLLPSVSVEEQLYPLKRELLSVFVPSGYHSGLMETMVPQGAFIESAEGDFRVNLSLMEYDKEDRGETFKSDHVALKYILLILREEDCCLYPYFLEFIEQEYPRCKLFLVIESHQSVEEKVAFFKAYDYSVEIVDIWHSDDEKSREHIVDEIVHHLQSSLGAKSLWRESWIALRDEVESKEGVLSAEEKYALAGKYNLTPALEGEIFSYLKQVGSMRK